MIRIPTNREPTHPGEMLLKVKQAEADDLKTIKPITQDTIVAHA